MKTADRLTRKLAELAPLRGYHQVYRPNESNPCPGCGRIHWHIGRVMAECAFCATAIPLPEAPNSGAGATHWTRGRVA